MENVLKYLEDNNVLIVKLSDDKTTVKFTDGCDEHYEVELSKKQLFFLTKELQDICFKMKHTEDL